MKKAVFPGSFDPPTHGHINIISRAIDVFDEIHVVIAVNSQKNYLFTADERFTMMQTLCRPFENVHVHIWEKLIVNFARKIGAKVLLKGVRAISDFNYEFELSMINRSLDTDIETLLMPTEQRYIVLRSSVIRELVWSGGDITPMVPGAIIQQVVARLKKKD